jgi:hypothetical protein
MTVLTEPVKAPAGQWLSLAEAAAALGCSPDTVRRRIREDKIPHRFEAGRYLVNVGDLKSIPRRGPAIPANEMSPELAAILQYLRERDAQRDLEVAQLREELRNARSEAVLAATALPPGKPWSPFAWIRQLWATQ